MPPKEKRRPGRPSLWKPEFVEQGRKLCLLGATDVEIANFFEVSEQTITAWKKVYPEFLASLKEGKIQADAEVSSKLYHRAKGYTHDAVKIFLFEGQPVVVPYTEHYAPDTTACIFWLKNRRPDLWRDRDHTKNDDTDKAVTSLAVKIRDALGEIDRSYEKKKPDDGTD